MCAVSNAKEPVQLMSIQNINAGDTLKSIEEKYGEPIKKFGNSRTYSLDVINPKSGTTLNCLVKANYNTSYKTKETNLDQLLWKSEECKSLMGQSGYVMYANSKAYKAGDNEATFFFDYKDAGYSVELNKTSIPLLVDDVKKRNVTSITLTSYESENDQISKELAMKRAITIKDLLVGNGLDEGIIYKVEKVKDENCKVDAECLIKPWVIKANLN